MNRDRIIAKVILISIAAITFASCTLCRGIRYWDADIDDHKIFHNDTIKCGDNKFHFHRAESDMVYNPNITLRKDSVKISLDSLMKRSSTIALVIIKNDTVLFENYYRGHKRGDVSTIFSMTKSVTSTLIGIAIDQGYITSVHDTVTKYIPELKKRDSNFSKLTIEHLLNMRTGFKFNENRMSPFAKIAKLHYGTNILGVVKSMRFEHEPGTVHEYQSISTAVLGIVLERATKTSYAKYLEQNLWKPLGMEHNASISVDSKRKGVAKAYGGLNAAAIDIAKIGRLYLNNGKFNGKQILSEDWVKRCTESYPENDWYKYQWYNGYKTYSDSTGYIYKPDSISAVNYAKQKGFKTFSVYKRWKEEKWGISIPENNFQAVGIMKQMMHVDKDNNVIVVRLGYSSDYGVLGEYFGFLRSLAMNAHQ